MVSLGWFDMGCLYFLYVYIMNDDGVHTSVFPVTVMDGL